MNEEGGGRRRRRAQYIYIFIYLSTYIPAERAFEVANDEDVDPGSLASSSLEMSIAARERA